MNSKLSTKVESVVVFIDGHDLYQSWLNLFGKREPDIEMIKNLILSSIGKIRLGRYFIHLGVPGAPKFDEFLESIGLPAVRTVNINVHTSLVAEAMEALFQVDFDALVLVAGENDYVPLVKKFIAHGKKVFILFFSEATGRWIKSQCNEFLDIADVLPQLGAGEYKGSGASNLAER